MSMYIVHLHMLLEWETIIWKINEEKNLQPEREQVRGGGRSLLNLRENTKSIAFIEIS